MGDWLGFNEAAGIHRRKPAASAHRSPGRRIRFNEAAGIHRRKLQREPANARMARRGFNEAAGIHRRKPANGTAEIPGHIASMRPPEFTGGNDLWVGLDEDGYKASMRPPEFTGGNGRVRPRPQRRNPGFNEAAGIHRRKPYNSV